MAKLIISTKNGETSYKMDGNPHEIAKSIVEIAINDDYFRKAITDAFANVNFFLKEKDKTIEKLTTNMMLSKW